MKSSYSGFPEGLLIMLEPSGPNSAPHPKQTFNQSYRCYGYLRIWYSLRRVGTRIYEKVVRKLRNLEHSHDASQTFGHPKSHTLGQPAKGQS